MSRAFKGVTQRSGQRFGGILFSQRPHILTVWRLGSIEGASIPKHDVNLKTVVDAQERHDQKQERHEPAYEVSPEVWSCKHNREEPVAGG